LIPNYLNKTIIYHGISNYKQIRTIKSGLYEWFIKAEDTFAAEDIIGQYLQKSKIEKKNSILPGGSIISIHTTGAVCQETQLSNLVIKI